MCVCFTKCTERKAATVCVLTVRLEASSLLPTKPGRVSVNGGASGLLLLLLPLFLLVLVVLVVCLQQLVPPGEGGGVVPDEVHVVEVVETSASVERDQVERVQGNVIATDREKKIKN